MRGRLIGFAFATLVLILMCSALVVWTGEGTQDVPVQRIQPVIGSLPPTLSPHGETDNRDEKPLARLAPVLTVLVPLQPSADANGTPVIHMPYLRANFAAFRLSDSAG